MITSEFRMADRQPESSGVRKRDVIIYSAPERPTEADEREERMRANGCIRMPRCRVTCNARKADTCTRPYPPDVPRSGDLDTRVYTGVSQPLLVEPRFRRKKERANDFRKKYALRFSRSKNIFL